MSFSKSFGTYFCTSNFNDLSFLCQLNQIEATYLFRKPRIVAVDCNYETGIKSVMKGSGQDLVKIILFQIRLAGPPLGWCYTKFLLWFKELYIRAFKWCIICVRIPVERQWKLKRLEKRVKTYGRPCTVYVSCLIGQKISISYLMEMILVFDSWGHNLPIFQKWQFPESPLVEHTKLFHYQNFVLYNFCIPFPNI